MNMNLKILGAAALLAGGLGLSSAATAAPAAPIAGLAGSDLIEQVAQGCGRGFARGPRGFCRPIRAFGPPRGYARPRFYGPRRCFVRATPYGPRRICR
jgi:hypothetical protein